MSKTAKNKRFNYDNELIYRPKVYPFEMIESFGYVVQTGCFVETGDYEGDGAIKAAYFKGRDGKDVEITELAFAAECFDSTEDAVHCICGMGIGFAEGDDGNVYPRVLKVRKSCIVEGVAFEASVNRVEEHAKIEGVA